MADGFAQSIIFWGQERSPKYSVEKQQLPKTLSNGEVLVKVDIATICGSDLHTLQGTRNTAHPCVMGHEGCGTVVTSAREGVKEGDKVTWAICDSCGKCLSCKLNLQNKCHKLLKFGHTLLSDAELFGTYSSHVLLRPGVPVVNLPQVLTPQVAGPANCALSTMVNAMFNLPENPQAGQDGASVALIQGAGLLGIYGCALLKEAGYKKIFCVDVNLQRLAMVEKFGGTPIHAEDEHKYIKPESVDVVFEVCGNKTVIPRGVSALRTGGTYMLIGLVHPDSHLDLSAETMIRKCLTIKGLHNYNIQHLQEAIKFLHKNYQKYPFSSLVGPSYPLSRFQEAVDVAETGKFHRVALDLQEGI